MGQLMVHAWLAAIAATSRYRMGEGRGTMDTGGFGSGGSVAT